MTDLLIKERVYMKKKMRSFYLTVLIVPKPMRPVFVFTYLFARLLDDIVDNPSIDLKVKKTELNQFYSCLMGKKEFSDPFLKDLFPQLPTGLIEHIQRVLFSIRKGFLSDFKGVNYKTPNQLDRYTYLVAGSVGKFIIEVYLYFYPTDSNEVRNKLLQNGIRYGKGLQIINIVKDLALDLDRDCIYIPGVSKSITKEQLSSILEILLPQIQDNLLCGLCCVNTITKWRLRVAFAFPLWIGLYNLPHFKIDSYYANFERQKGIKISKIEFYKAIAISIMSGTLPKLGDWFFSRLISKV